ncbi:PHD finger protein enhancer of yellow 3 isoform X2 [Bombus fervidus]|uniref:PHD finger protein enhancer of yellow 3 isoform X2 n=1 Tax=Bombus fervidus TaxID=203811 RepID=UPI003AB62A31
MFDHAEIIVPAEDTKDESMEEEVNLTLKLEETESQSEIMKSDIEVDPENKKENSTEEIVKESQLEIIKNDVTDKPENQQSSTFYQEIMNESQPEIVTKSQLEIVKSDGKEEPETRKYAKLPKETLIENEKNFIINMDDNIAHSTNVETTSDVEMDAETVVKIADAEDLELNKNEEVSNKQQLEDNLKCDTNKDNLKDILETASKVEDIFSEEQCQSTQDIVTSILDDVRNATDFKNILSTEAVVANEIEEVLQQSGNIPLAETEIEELTEKLPQDSEDILNKDMEDSISEHIDSLEGLLGLDLIPEGEDSSLKATKAEEELQKSDQLSKVVDMSLLLEQSDPISDMAQTSDYITQVISSCLTDQNDLSLETTKKSNTVEVVDDKVKKSPASDILKIDGSIIVESIDKDENVEDLQKDLKQVTDLEENELDIDFEEAQLESVGDLEDIESQPEIDKNDVDEESENIKNARLSEEIVAEDQENLVINMDDNTVNATNVETASDIEIELASDILLHNMDHNDKAENVGDIQKDLKVDTDLTEIEFEEAHLESVGDLEEIESQAEIAKSDLEEIESQAEIAKSDLEEIESQAEITKGDVKETEPQAEIVKSDLEEIKLQAEIVKSDLEEIKLQAEIVKSDLEEIKLQAEIVNSDVREMESQVEMPESESDVEETESQTEIAKGDVEETEAQTKIAVGNIEETESQTERAEDDVEETESQAKIVEDNTEETVSQAEITKSTAEKAESQAEIIKGDVEETESKVKINKSNIEETETQINIAKGNVEEESENENNMELTEEIIIESQPKIMKSSVEEKCANNKKMEFTEKIVTESQSEIKKCDIEEESENRKELPVELPIELPAQLPEKIVTEDQENLVINMDNNTVNLANVERTSNIDTSNILLHNMDCYVKEEDVGDLQKVFKGGTNLTENELGMDFEGAPLESVGDLEETELQLAKIDAEEESENRKHIELSGEIVTEPQPEVVKNADEEEHENKKAIELSEEIITKIQENLVIDMDVNDVDLSNMERSNDIETQLTSDILLHNVGQDNKDNNFENLQKDLREGTNLDMDFEEAPLESIGDLEETESQLEIVKNDIEGDTSENRKNAGLSEAIVTEDNPAEGNLAEANLTEANLTEANLTEANLTEANLTEDNLTEANLTEDNLTEANLTEDNLTEDNLTEDNLTEENLVTNMKDNIADFPNMERSSDIELELPSDILLRNVDHDENLDDARSAIETSQPSSEISELESAVKFLQESEEQAMDSPLVLSPKMMESVVDDISKQADASSLFVPNEDICENTSELEVELQNITTDSISISEAEIISEAAKLESERKLAEQIKIDALQDKFEIDDDKETINEGIIEGKITLSETKFSVTPLENIEIQQLQNLESNKVSDAVLTLPHVSPNVLKTSESIPKVSILEERLREPPKIEIPTTDVAKVSISPNISKDSLLIQKDAKLIAYQKMLESPKMSDKSESKIVDTPRKDSEKHDFENVGSPRIILKIAKSAITDCGEPRSPKSPKIRSATNSPNPEDSPGQKLGKIKLKLSKGGHPSIISNENIEEVGQWYSEGSSSLSPLGMKIKFSKSGDPSIVSAEKYESIDDCKEGKHKFEETVRTESPIGMKIKLSKSGDASIVQQDAKEMQIKHKDKLDMVQESPKRTESPIGMKIKLSKTGDASIIQSERQDFLEEYKDNVQIKPKEKLESCYGSPKRTDSPIGMKIKLSKSGDASIVSPDLPEENKDINKMKDKLELSPEIPKRTESPIGMKIKLAKTKGGGASIISVENSEEVKDKLEISDIPKRTESPLGMKIKLSKTGDASIVHSEVLDEIKDKMDTVQDASKSLESSHIEVPEEEQSVETIHETSTKIDSPLGMKIKLSKFGDASIVSLEKQEQLEESPKRTESPLGMKIKLSKSGDASIIQTDTSEDANKTIRTIEAEHSKTTDASLGMKIKLLKTGDASIVDPEKKDREQRRRDAESSLEMKIKLSKVGHPTIVACDNQAEVYKSKEAVDPSQNFAQRYKEPGQIGHKEPALKILKSGNSTILQSNRSELTIEPVQMQGKKLENVIEMSPKRKDITIAPIESKKSKLETQLTQILPEVTIQPVTSREQKQFLFDPKNSAISLQQMNVINQEISITQVRPQKSTDASMNEKLKDILSKNVSGSPLNSDCEIIEHRSELIIVNENSNSSQDVVIIEEVSTNRMPEVKVPKKRGRPRRNPLPQGITHPPPHLLMSRDSLPLDDAQQMQQPQVPHFPQSRENERPKRTCRSQKSYAPPRRGRGRGRGKRKLDAVDPQIMKKPRIEQDLNAIEASTTAVITIDDSGLQQEPFIKSPELYKALKQPAMDSKIVNSSGKVNKKIMGQKNGGVKSANIVNNTLPDSTGMQSETNKTPEMRLPKPISNDVKDKKLADIVPERMQKTATKLDSDNRSDKPMENAKLENKDMLVPPGHPNWLTPASKRTENTTKHENMSMVQVIDEETRMSAESGSRSQTPARNISAPVNEESQGSVLSTATTESEKVKVKNRRMEINFDPDEGPFTVDKIAEYEWPLDRKGETFMIQEQISQYLGVKSFKRKYPDLKRRVVDMEERNYLRENGLVSEAMCDMGLTAICSSEVLDVMCSDFPDQYEEYRKHMREKQVKEHSKKQKELTAAANAEKNRIDLAEMAVQSALSWNISLNKARRENRKCSLDLQTFTIHVPKKQQEVESERRIGHYPVALIPGQYTDYYREYTPAELRYYPLNTVLYGPMRPNERKFDSQSEGSQSDTDSDSSSDDSSSTSSEGTQDTEGSQSTMDDVDMEITNRKDEIKLKCKMCLKTLNKHSKNEVLIQCGTCNGHVHPSCIDLTLDMVPHIQSYAWQCTDCKTCAQCHDPADEDKMLFCDMCDRGYHIYCVGLRRVPQGRWHCQECAVCVNCGSREPGGINSDRNSVAQWQHEYKKGDKNTRVYVSTLCVPCSKLWRKGRYCPHCSRCHTAPRLDLEVNLVHCSACDKYLHLGCVETKGMPLDRKNYLCDFCAPNRQQMVKSLISRTLRT